ncbi:DUF5802 family protein [Halarchaeum salinum]|uniref:DUF5802 family protein n=1 Tax=Halarchaeum salinum TaxID=489912 RepID=A0AAV3S978_9EURY
MFEVFSTGYYLGRLYVEPSDDGTAALQRRQHERVNEQVYAGEGLARTDYPLVMKVGTRHYRVEGDADVPADTLVVPRETLEDAGVDNPPALAEVLLARPDHARRLFEVGAV